MQTKVCHKCKKEKRLSEFGTSSSTNDGKTVRCLQCKREYAKKHSKTPAGIYQQIKSRVKYVEKHPEQYRRCGKPKFIGVSQDEFVEWYNNEPKVCHYCGIEEKNIHVVFDSFNNRSDRLTIDCKDNSKGYVKDNMVIACHRCNFVKSDFFTEKEMLDIATRHIKKKWKKRMEHN